MNFNNIIFTDPKFGSKLELDYCVHQLRRRELSMARAITTASAFNTLFTPLYFYVLCPSTINQIFELILVHAFLLLILVASGVYLWSSPGLKYLNLGVNSFCISYLFYFSASIPYENSDFALAFTFDLLALTIFFLILPFRNRIHWVVCCYFVPILAAYLYFANAPLRIFFIGLVVISISSSIGIFFYRYVRLKLIREFREISRYVPHQIILHSVTTGTLLAEIYDASERFCVCLSSDWRSFQKATQQLSPEKVGSVLAAYYKQINILLSQHFPRGNYFYDWIADELFAVIFIDAHTSEAPLVEEALTFAKEVILSRSEFETQFGLPSGLDIGLSAGHAVIGIFGPEGQSKATAFGESPGISRRIQTLGKELRSRISDCDRVIFGEDVRSYLTSTEYRTIEFEEQMVKDITDLKFYYTEPDLKN